MKTITKDFADTVHKLAVDYWKWVDKTQYGKMNDTEKRLYKSALLNFCAYVIIKSQYVVDTVSKEGDK